MLRASVGFLISCIKRNIVRLGWVEVDISTQTKYVDSPKNLGWPKTKTWIFGMVGKSATKDMCDNIQSLYGPMFKRTEIVHSMLRFLLHLIPLIPLIPLWLHTFRHSTFRHLVISYRINHDLAVVLFHQDQGKYKASQNMHTSLTLQQMLSNKTRRLIHHLFRTGMTNTFL